MKKAGEGLLSFAGAPVVGVAAALEKEWALKKDGSDSRVAIAGGFEFSS